MDKLAASRGEPEPVHGAATRLIEQVRDQAMFVVDRQGRVASWNEGVERILGWRRVDWIGQPLAVAFTLQDVGAGVHAAEMQQAAATGRADDNRWMRRRNGDHFYALGEMVRVLDDEGVHVGYLKVLRDFSEQRQAAQERERLLRSESEARARAEGQAAAFTAAIETMSDGVCIGDRHRVQRCNRAALALLGLASLDELQADADVLVQRLRLRRERHGPLLDGADWPYARAAGGQPASLELWAARGGGAGEDSDVCLRCSARPVRVDGQVVGVVAVFSDLTERLSLHRTGRTLTEVETVLHERNAELRALVDGVRDYAIFTLSPEGIINSWHQGAVLMKGYTAEEAIGMRFEQLFKAEDRAAGRPQMEMDVAARTGEYKGDGQRLRKDGTVFDAAVVLTPLRGADGQLRGFLKLTHDITARKRMEREREEMLRDAQQARQEAERASHSKGEFLATISHELRTPLSAIQGWAHVLERGVFDPETVQHGLAAISRNARTQVQLIEDLLDMNRIESGQLRLDLQRIELGGVIASAIDSALPAATAKGIGMRTVFGSATGQVMGDAARLQQVVGNLLNNAIKFTPQGGQVSVVLKQQEGIAQVVVSDTGQGIEADFLARVFDRFQQQDATITRRHGGLGIGLAIVRHLVQLHGGQVQAQSPGPGLGATFTVSLPVLPRADAAGSASASVYVSASASGGAAAAEAPPQGPRQGRAPNPAALPVPPSPPVRLDGVRVLLIDDEPDVRAVTERVLTEAGAQVLLASQAGQGLEILQQQLPSVILSDIGMPGIDGYDFMRRVRSLSEAQGGHTPAAAFTAYTRPDDRQRSREAGYQLHLSKPVPPTELVQAVATLAAGRP
jgi:PAS domain S-box-containing protein